MGQVIIVGRNDGYPCLEELVELSEVKLFSPPYPMCMLMGDAAKNDGYPSLATLEELAEGVSFQYPYPDLMMRCLGEAVNDGYPVLMTVSDVKEHCFSDLFFAGYAIDGMYFNGRFVSEAYCNDIRVFGFYYALSS